MIKQTEIIIWDEAVMAHKHVYLAIDRTLRDIMSQKDKNLKNVPFGGIKMPFGGDFRQILPVSKRANRSAIVQSCINKTPFWKYVKKYKLTQNMRISEASSNLNKDKDHLKQFSDFLLSIGDGLAKYLPNKKYNDSINLPFAKNMDENELIHLIYPELYKNACDSEFMCNRAILASKNSDVDRINDHSLELFPGQSITYLSTDSINNNKQQSIYPTEFLNKISGSGLPPHKLSLKKNQPIILLRNIDQHNGLCNGTRLIV